MVFSSEAPPALPGGVSISSIRLARLGKIGYSDYMPTTTQIAALQDRLTILTASYHAYRTDMGLAIRTSVSAPPHFRAAPQARSLTPYGIFSRSNPLPHHEYEARYTERLRASYGDVLDDLTRLSVDTDTIVLLCYCNLTKHKSWCHRTMAADFLTDQGFKTREVQKLYVAPPRIEPLF